MAQNTSHAVMAQRAEPSDSLDLFPTPPWATRALCEWLSKFYTLEALSVWEPACGLGDMVHPLAKYFRTVKASDIHAYGYGEIENFLFAKRDERHDFIITNPPFRLAEDFIPNALTRSRVGVAMLVRTSFLEGVARYNRLYSFSPPTDILQFTERVPMHKGRLVENGSTATAYCWLVWRKESAPEGTRFHWLAPCRKRLERAGDYEPKTREAAE